MANRPIKKATQTSGLRFFSLRNYFFAWPAFFAAQRALAAALILALAAALIVNFFFAGLITAGLTIGAVLESTTTLAAGLAAFTFAHLASCAALIRAIPAALIVNFFFAGLAAVLTA